MTINTTSAPDPMDFPFAQWRSPILTAAGLVGKSPRHPRINPGEKTGVFITAGQSLAAGTCEGFYTPINAAKCDHINIYDGGMYNAVDPLAGHGLAAPEDKRACVFTRVADKLISGGQFQRVILIPVAYGGTTVKDWDTGGAAGFPLHHLILVAVRRARALGIDTINGILWQQGETDSAGGTGRWDYGARFQSMKAKVAKETTAPWFVAKSTYVPGGSTSAGIRAAMDDVTDHVTVFPGPDCDVLGASYRYDDQHWNAAGNEAAATLWHNALEAVF